MHGKTIVIIGGTSGLGFATAKAAIACGNQVLIGGSKRDQLAQALAELGPGAGGDVLDIVSEDSVNDFFAGIDQLDHLLITAAVVKPGALLETPLDQLRINLDSRLWGSIFCMRAAVPRMADEGSVTLTSGMVAQRPQAGKSLAAVAAGAVETLAHSLVAELAPRRINVISPGPMKTPLLEQALGQDPARLQGLAQSQPLKRLGDPQDYAEAALFLMRNRNVNGEVLRLNGGSAWA